MTHPFTKLVAVAFLVGVVLIFFPYQYRHHLEPLFVLAVGWFALPARVLGEVDWEPLAWVGVGVAVGIVGVHLVVCRCTPSHRVRLTAEIVALPALLFAVGVASVGAVTQVRHLTRQRWYGYELDGRLVQRVLKKNLAERLAEDPKYLDDLPVWTLDFADDVHVVVLRRPDNRLGAVAVFRRVPAPAQVWVREGERTTEITFDEFRLLRLEIESGRRPEPRASAD